ncbi:F-type H+-transporting ATPase subunit a [Desulfobaculum xiamenense]|uniref:ATP synthase subunit a n=1 Tax=Desulfobaculum xiamenense TaxID=995050 RepID=A0A846QIL7_9BACT|nr:F0F1 ATP synthase subunit A [Desulfobaculum xiamenense]NJB68078.1 F-type H+-transporting ATPase subunit a [Desulfobaculum xiamenense]
MEITPDMAVYWRFGPAVLNRTIVLTWLVMVLLVGASWLVTRRMVAHGDILAGVRVPRWQTVLEATVLAALGQAREILNADAGRLMPFLTTLFLFIAVSNLVGSIPGFDAPTGSLSTTVALALCVFVLVPAHGIMRVGFRAYLRNYLQPTALMLPLNVFAELSRTMALAVRLFGNVMSGRMMGAILLVIAPLFVPVPMLALGLLLGMVQAYIFAVLAAVYIAAGIETESQH